jgi:hypothetical protein
MSGYEYRTKNGHLHFSLDAMSPSRLLVKIERKEFMMHNAMNTIPSAAVLGVVVVGEVASAAP